MPWVFLGSRKLKRSQRLGMLVTCALQAGAIVLLSTAILAWADGADRSDWLKRLMREGQGVALIVAFVTVR